MIEKLDWDSQFFGYQIGKLILSNNADYKYIFSQDTFDLIYVFSNEIIYDERFFHADNKVVFHKRISKRNYNADLQIKCFSFDNSTMSYSELEALAIESGKYSRFKLDSNFVNNEFEKLYKQWIYQSVNKKIAMEVLVYQIDNRLAGFISIGKKSDRLAGIGLVAVSPEFQGKGIGSILVKAAENYSIENGFTEIQVVTQEFNENAVKLYRKNGFNLLEKTYIYHYWKNVNK